MHVLYSFHKTENILRHLTVNPTRLGSQKKKKRHILLMIQVLNYIHTKCNWSDSCNI